VAELTGPWLVVEVVVDSSGPDQAHNRKLPDERGRAPKPRSRNRRPLDERERAPNPLRHRHRTAMPEHAAFPVVIQSFCITPILAFFNSFLGLSRHLSRLDKPKKLLTDNEGSG
jgi:hypothetical protein